MLKNNLTTSYKLSWNKNRLRLVLALFFLALAIPTAILIKQAYSQLKWEAFHHYRLQAEELANRIDHDYQQLIEVESARTFTDYSFLNVAANTQAQFLQRSPLSAFPVNPEFPGIVGYFQIDHNGKFTTPLLPPETSTGQDYGISRSEKEKRQHAQNSIYQILSQNKLVTKPVTKITQAGTSVTPDNDSNEARRRSTGKTEAGNMIFSDQMDAAETVAEPASILESEQPQVAAPQVLAREQSTPARIAAEQIQAEQIQPQAAFDKLQEKKAYASSPSSSNTYSKSKGRLDDLKLKKQYLEKSLEQFQQKEVAKLKSKKQVVSRRKESNVLPEFRAQDSVSNNRPVKKDESLQVTMFESEIDAFEFSLLESGHFVLYRKVWRNGLRYIQGFLVNPDIFIQKIIARSFYNANVSQASNLTIAYQGNILSTLNSKPTRDSYSSRLDSSASDTLQGTLLLQKNLSTTLEQLELVFSVNQLPAGPGGSVITWLSVILLLVLSGGFYGLYVLGLKQLVLARQQQDFVSAVSHELKTPLTSIRMYGEMLREGWTTEEKRKQYYDYIYDESERLTRLINNVLQLARMTRNELPVNLKPHTIAELLDNTHSKINSQVERAEFTLNLSCDEEIREKTLLVDADYFIQVIINLVDNAIKFSAKSDKKQIDIQCKALRNNNIEFSIRDYGPGIDKDQLRKIFNLFYRSENELTRETVGTGIGLSLVKQLVTSMHGKIDAVNMEPGIEFQITFTTT